jgi:hypothetical protein
MIDFSTEKTVVLFPGRTPNPMLTQNGRGFDDISIQIQPQTTFVDVRSEVLTAVKINSEGSLPKHCYPATTLHMTTTQKTKNYTLTEFEIQDLHECFHQ